VLGWIKNNDSKRDVFVTNHVTTILEHIPSVFWCYVETLENPADMTSRGVSPDELKKKSMWTKGPNFIRQSKIKLTAFDEEPIVAPTPVNIATLITADNYLVQALDNISTWKKTRAVVAFMLKARNFLHFFRERKTNPTLKRKHTLRPNVAEIEEAERIIISLNQRATYASEFRSIKLNLPILKGRLSNAFPFLDKHGIMRVGERLLNASMPFAQKHPIILPDLEFPKNPNEETTVISPLTKKIIRWAHESTIHGGEYNTLAFLLQKYHVPNAHRAIKYLIYRCVICRTVKA
jgi:Integrase zinc binding domain